MEERRHNPALKIAAQRIDRLTEEIERKDATIAKLNDECAELSDMNMYLEEQVKDYEKALKEKNNSLYGDSVKAVLIADGESLDIIAEAERDLMMKKCKLINQINDIDGLNKLATQMYLKIDYDTDVEFESLLRAFIQTTEKIIGELKNET